MSAESDWFENIENFRPLRGGRRASTLNEVASIIAKYSITDAEEKFLIDFENANKSTDPLEIMWKYACWFEEHFPTGKQKYFYPILYKICSRFSTLRYNNDERMLKLWIKLAENFPESGLAVMELAFIKGSCRQLSRFYVFWSEMYQIIGLFNKAREKLQLGLEMHATPIQAIHFAMDELEAKAMRSALKESDDECLDPEETFRETLGRLRGLGKKHFAPIVRASVPHGKVAVSKSLQQKSQHPDSFAIFVDDFETRESVGTRESQPGCRIVGDLTNDPEYQALFGNLDFTEKPDINFTNKENLISRAKDDDLQTRERQDDFESQEIPDFIIYKEENEGGFKNAKNSTVKMRIMLRKELKGISMEEAYARRVIKNFL